MIIAVDGPTASGKGTIARALAAHFGLPHLDTGLLYRAVGRAVVGSTAERVLQGPDPVLIFEVGEDRSRLFQAARAGA